MVWAGRPCPAGALWSYGPGVAEQRERSVLLRPDIAFVVLAYAWSWAWWVPIAASGVTTRAGQTWPSHLPGLLGPAIAAVVVTAAVSGRAGLADLGRRVVRVRVGWFWYAVVVATAGIGAGAVALQGLFGRGWPTADELSTYSGAGLMPWAVLVVLVLVVNGFGEETGWRGFLVERWGPGRGLLRTSLLVTAVWAPWHLPLFWVSDSFRSFGPAGTVGWLVSITAGSVVLTWMYLGCGASIWIVALWHTVFNMVTATPAGADLAAPVLSAAVIAAAIVLLRHARSQTGAGAVGPTADADTSLLNHQ
jgi:membrane protease YdiL (CAAX protease family)